MQDTLEQLEKDGVDDNEGEENLLNYGDDNDSDFSLVGEEGEEDEEDDEGGNGKDGEDPQQVVLKVEKPKARKNRKSKTRRKTEHKDKMEELEELIESLDPGAATKVFMTITRPEPMYHAGIKVGGYLGKIHRHIDAQEIQDRWGGGTYDIRFFGPAKRKDGTSGGNRMLTSRRIEIAGDPIMPKHKPDEDKKQDKDHDPNIVQQTLNAQEKMMQRLYEKSDREKEEIVSLLGNKDSGSKDLMMVFTKMIELQEARAEAAAKNAQAQLEVMREEARLAREEATRKEERYKEEMKEIRREMEQRNSSSTSDMVSFLRDSKSEDMKRMELTMQMMSKQFQNQLEMIQSNNKMQADLLTNELKRTSDELKDARVSGKSDLVSEIKKMTSIQGLIKNMGSGGDEKSISDKITDSLPDILESAPNILKAVGDWFRPGGKQVAQRPVARVPTVPRRLASPPPQPRPPAKSSFPDSKPVEDEAPPPVQHQQALDQMKSMASTPEEKKNVELAQEISKLKVLLEESLSSGEDANACYERNIMGKYSRDTLMKIAAMPTAFILQMLQENLDNESPLFTVKGKDFLRQLHGIVKEKIT